MCFPPNPITYQYPGVCLKKASSSAKSCSTIARIVCSNGASGIVVCPFIAMQTPLRIDPTPPRRHRMPLPAFYQATYESRQDKTQKIHALERADRKSVV